jgi:hypothetical protein
MNFPQQASNTTNTGQQKIYMGGTTGYNYPPQPIYGPTGVAIPHQEEAIRDVSMGGLVTEEEAIS